MSLRIQSGDLCVQLLAMALALASSVPLGAAAVSAVLAVVAVHCAFAALRQRAKDSGHTHEFPLLLVLLAWLAAVACPLDASSRLLAGCFLASQGRLLRGWQLGAGVSLWFAVGLATSSQSDLGAFRLREYLCLVGPLMLLISELLRWPTPQVKHADTEEVHLLQSVNSNVDAQWLERSVTGVPGWEPPSSGELRTFKKAFGATIGDEKLVAVYPCAVRRKWMHHGRLFLSSEHVSFTSAMRLNQFSLPLHDIEAVQSGEQRDVVTLVLPKPVWLAGYQDPVNSIDLHCQALVGVILAALVERCRRRGPAEVETWEEDAPGFDAFEEADSDPDRPARSNPPSLGSTSLREWPSWQSSSGDSFHRQQDEASQPFRVIMQAHIPRLTPLAVVKDIFAEEWRRGSLFLDLYEAYGAENVKASAVMEEPALPSICSSLSTNPMTRQLSFVVPVPAPMYPKTTPVVMTMHMSQQKSEGDEPTITVESCTDCKEVPFGHCFIVQERTIIAPSAEGVWLQRFARVLFLKSCGFLGPLIQKYAIRGVTDVSSQLVRLLRLRAEGPMDIWASVISSPTMVLQIYELQRRTTRFHTDWRAPFLPHDGSKAWRWVDTSYKRHSWTITSVRAEAALSDTPPVEPPADRWRAVDDWQLVTATSQAGAMQDADGWQYAINFWRPTHAWTANDRGCVVRRRLWSRTFAEMSELAEVVRGPVGEVAVSDFG